MEEGTKTFPFQGYNDSRLFMEAAGCAPLATPDAELACMRNISYSDVVQVAKDMSKELGSLHVLICDTFNWSPLMQHVVDGNVIPYQLLDAYKLGKFNKGSTFYLLPMSLIIFYPSIMLLFSSFSSMPK
jgi:hypothetical protein